MQVFCVVGSSGSGKTTLLEALIPALMESGKRVSALKHSHKHFPLDQPGKDSARLHDAGAGQVLLANAVGWSLTTHHQQSQPDLDQLIGHMIDTDVLLVEGFKTSNKPKIWVVARKDDLGNDLKPNPILSDPTLIAIVCPATHLSTVRKLAGATPVYDRDYIGQLRDLLISRIV